MGINLHHSLIEPDSGADLAATVVLLHGLFGMGGNLGALARELGKHFSVYSVDLPNHGRSDWTDSADIPTMARCIMSWMDEQGIEQAHFVGHSLGGKIAMQLALHNGQRVAGLCIADIAPVQYSPHHDDVMAALSAVASCECRSRKEASEIMAHHLKEEMLIQFLLMSIKRDPDKIYRWRFNLAEIIAGYEGIRAGLDSPQPFMSNVLFIKGGDSDYIRPEHRDRIIQLFPKASVKVMPECGHWLHAQKPQLLELSGVGDKKVLEENGVPVVKHLPGVGENLQDHLTINVTQGLHGITTFYNETRPHTMVKNIINYLFRRKGLLTHPAAQAGLFFCTEESGKRPIAQVHFAPAAGETNTAGNIKTIPGTTATVCNLRPESRGSIHITSNNPESAPAIRANYLATEGDQKVMIAAIRKVREVFKAPALDKYRGDELNPGVEAQSDEEILNYVRSDGESVYHPVGTCKMGKDKMAS